MSPDVKKFTAKILDIPKGLSLKTKAKRIRDAQMGIYGKKTRKAKSFSESRFSSLGHIFKVGLTSCGSMSTVLGFALSKLGYEVKYVHGTVIDSPPDFRHAWLKVHEPKFGKWIILDPTNKNFQLYKKARQKKVYRNWKDLKVDYLKGNY